MERKSVERNCTYFDSAGRTFVFSVDEVFSYSVVDLRGVMPLLGPTVRFPFVGSYFVVRGFTGLVRAGREMLFSSSK